MQYKTTPATREIIREMNIFDQVNGTKLPTDNVYEESYQVGEKKIRYFLNKTNIALIDGYSYE